MVNKQPPSELWHLARMAQNDSKRWFGESGVDAELSHMVLALCGESGNLANIVKQINRGTLDPNNAHAHFDLVMALSDIFVYVLNIAALLQCDLLRAYEQQRIQNEKRFRDEKAKREQEPRPTGWVSYDTDE